MIKERIKKIIVEMAKVGYDPESISNSITIETNSHEHYEEIVEILIDPLNEKITHDEIVDKIYNQIKTDVT